MLAAIYNEGEDMLFGLVKSPAECLLKDDRYVIDSYFFERVLAGKVLVKSEITEIKLGDIRRRWFDGTVYPLTEVAPYKYLCGDKEAYDDYCLAHNVQFGVNMQNKGFDNLIKSLDEKGYDEKSIIIIGYDNVIIDGQHRSCYLLHKYGPEHKIRVLKIKTRKRLSVRVKNFFKKLKKRLFE